jgi:hypothetical protein
MNVIGPQNNGVSYQNRWTKREKESVTNKNMIKMGVIIKGVYCIIKLIVDAWKKI